MSGCGDQHASVDHQTGSEELHRLQGELVRHSVKFNQCYTKDGRPLDWCIDLREALYRPAILKLIADLLWKRVRHLDPDYIGGMTLSAEQLTCGLLGSALADGRELNGFSVRRAAKTYGRRRQVEGVQPTRGSRVLIVDDLLDGGSTATDVIAALKPFEARIIGIAVVVDFDNPDAASKLGGSIPRISLTNLAGLGLKAARPGRVVRPKSVIAPLNVGEYTAPQSTPLIDNAGILAASDRGYVSSFDWSGREIWRVKVRACEHGVRTTLAAYDESVIFCGYDGFAYRVDRHSGEIRWSTRVGDFVGASPALDAGRGVAYLAANCRGSSNTCKFLKIDLSDGRVLWERAAMAESYARPAISNDRSVIHAANNGVVENSCCDQGTVRWQTRLPAQVKGWIAVDNQRCFLGCFDGFFYALDANSGDILWRNKLADWLLVHPVLTDRQVLVSSRRHLCSLSQEDGSVEWLADMGGRSTGVAVDHARRTCVAASDGGNLCGIDLISGKHLWQYQAKAAFRATPALSASLCAVPCYDGSLYIFELPDAAPDFHELAGAPQCSALATK